MEPIPHPHQPPPPPILAVCSQPPAISSSGTSPRYAALLVSLYLVLLAFFIVLTSLSDYTPPKQQDVIRSLQETFANHPRSDSLPTPTQAAPSQAHDEILQRLQQLLDDPSIQQLPASSLYPNRVSYLAPSSHFFPSDMQQPDSSSPAMQRLIALGAIWQDYPSEAPQQLLIRAPIHPSLLQSDSPQRLASSIQKLGWLAQKLQSSGIPESAMELMLDDSIPPQHLRLDITLPSQDPPPTTP